MHFDDRLDTVLKQPVRGEENARVQYVQLLDLLGKTAAGSGSSRLSAGFERLTSLSSRLSSPARADLLRSTGLRLRNPELVALLAEDEPALASAAIAAADLEERQWLDLIPALPVGARGVLRHRRDLGPAIEERLERLGIVDRGLPAADVPQAQVVAIKPRATAQPSPSPAQPTNETAIGAIVRRIEAFRKEHPAPSAPPSPRAPRLPLGDPDHLALAPVDRFDFVLDVDGRIASSDVETAPMVVGLSLASLPCRTAAHEPLCPDRAFRLRQPIERQIVSIAGAPAISGDWQIDAVPRFDPVTTRFTGYLGRARRVLAQAADSVDSLHGAGPMREMLHELRNPAGAIQMSSELIQQNIAGAVSHEYRSIAASIASDTALVLAGFDELERLVKLDARIDSLETGDTDLAALAAALAAQINSHTAQRESGLEVELTQAALAVSVYQADLERLVWRLLAALATATGPMEWLRLALDGDSTTARLEIALPAALRDLPDEELYRAQTAERGPALSSGMFGLGFTLRLAAAEARSAGGTLVRSDGRLVLTLPRAAAPSANISEG